MAEYPVSATQAGERLDRFLALAQPDLSRTQIQTLIRDGLVRVNDSRSRPSLRLRAGDRVEVDPPPSREVALEPENIPLHIVHQDEHLIVIDKPAGLVVHPGAGVPTGTLVHALLHHDPAIAGVGGAGRPGIVHRLDRDTSGLMVVARTSRAYRALIEAMRERRVRRVYHALVWGDPPADAGEIRGAIGRDPRHRQRMAVVRRGGKSAVTHWRVLERFGPAALVEARLESGRTHQIRVHFAHLGMPVVGDPVYGGRGKKLLSGAHAGRTLSNALLDGLPRQALHAHELALEHPVTGELMRWTSAVPEPFANVLALLRTARGS
ncbi:MAG: RluA family pseudouridine synthase [Candidatus Eiseniibacteriota bacterium]